MIPSRMIPICDCLSVDSKPAENANIHERRLWENLSLEKWPLKLYELVKGTNTEGFASLFTTIEACESNAFL
jgi:hypothetical protein